MRWTFRSAVLLMAGCLSAHTQTSDVLVYGTLVNGRPVTTLAPPSAKAVVLYFVATDCPVSNRAFPEMQRVRKQFAARGVVFWYVYPNNTETRDAVRKHQAAFDPTAQALLDDHGMLTRMFDAVATPEAVVLRYDLIQWKPIYAGRIDDRYVRLGLERPSIQNHFVERVLNELLSGQPIEPAVGNPVGCAIMRPSAEKALRR
jgi:hypothetical protein